MKQPLYRSDEQYAKDLARLREIALSDEELSLEDSNVTGNKYTRCNHGLCADEFKDDQNGVYYEKHHACPHDARFFNIDGSKIEPVPTGIVLANGCFWSCRAFGRLTRGDVKARIIRATDVK